MRYKLQRALVTVTSPGGASIKLSKATGTIDFDADGPQAARAELEISLRGLEADEFVRWKLSQELDLEKHPTATVTLERFESLREATAGGWSGVANLQLQWRGKTPSIKAKGTATVDRRTLEVRASFSLDVAELGVLAARLFSTGSVVTVQATFFAVVVER